MDKPAITKEIFDGLTDSEKAIANYRINGDHLDTCWSTLAKQVLEVYSSKTLTVKEVFKDLEISLLKKMEKSGQDVRRGRRLVSINSIMPNSTYRTAKSVIVSAINHGVMLRDAATGEIRPKSQVEKKIREKKKELGKVIPARPETIRVNTGFYVVKGNPDFETLGKNIGESLKKSLNIGTESVKDDWNRKELLKGLSKALNNVEEEPPF